MARRGMVAVAAVVALALTACEPASFALDPSYGTGGVADIGPSSSYLAANAFKVLVDGAVVLATLDGGVPAIVRLRPDGTMDSTFARHAPALTHSLGAIDVDGAGNVVAVENSEEQVVVRRLLPDGTPDASFDGDGIVVLPNWNRGGLVDAKFDHAGRIVVLFERDDPVPNSRCIVTRLLPNGTTDGAFGDGSPVTLDMPYSEAEGAGCRKILIRSDDGIYAIDEKAGVAALSPSGVVDASYSDGASTFVTTSYGGIVDAALLPDDGLALGSSNFGGPGTGFRLTVARLAADGQLDTAFGTGGIDVVGFGELQPQCQVQDTNYDRMGWLAATPEGSVLAVGSATCDGLAIARWSNGHLDDGFGTGGRVVIDELDLPGSHELDHPISGGIGPDNAVHTATSGQSILGPLTVARLIGGPR